MGDLRPIRNVHTLNHMPRPLGQVKSENLLFNSSTNADRLAPLLPSHGEPLHAYRGDEYMLDLVRPMRELRESLGHAALLNIVAAANSNAVVDGPATGVSSEERRVSMATHIPIPTHRSTPAPFPFHITSATGNRCSHVHGDANSEVDSEQTGDSDWSVESEHKGPSEGSNRSVTSLQLVASFLSPRVRTISIPRPHAHDVPGPFINKSVSSMKGLGRASQIVSASDKCENDGIVEKSLFTADRSVTISDGRKTATSMDAHAHCFQINTDNWQAEEHAVPPALVEPIRGHSLTVKENTTSSNPGTSLNSTVTMVTSTPVALIATSAPIVKQAQSFKAKQADSFKVKQTNSVKAEAQDKDDQRTNNVQHLLSLRHHMSMFKRRELVRRLTDMAHCEGVDILTNNNSESARFVPSMTILSHQRKEATIHSEDLTRNRSEEPFVSASRGHNQDNFARREMTIVDIPILKKKQMFKSSSPSCAVGHGGSSTGGIFKGNRHFVTALSTKSSLNPYDQSCSSTVSRCNSMPDIIVRAGDKLNNPQEQVFSEDSRSQSLFTDGILGKNIAKFIGSEKCVELTQTLPLSTSLRPPNNMKLRQKSKQLHHCSLGAEFRKRSAADTLQKQLSSASIQSRSKSGSLETPAEIVPPEDQLLCTQALPILTITALTREPSSSGKARSGSSAARQTSRPSQPIPPTSVYLLPHELTDHSSKNSQELQACLDFSDQGGHWQHGRYQQSWHPSSAEPVENLRHEPCRSSDRKTGSESLGLAPPHPATKAEEQIILSSRQANFVEDGDTTLKDDDPGYQNDDYGNTDEDFTQNLHISQAHQDEHYTHGRLSVSDSEVPTLAKHKNFDPVFQAGKEPLFQGFSSRVPDNDRRSQFHYVTAKHENTEEEQKEREMKFRILTALDEDVYYDFQHRKYRKGDNPLPPKLSTDEERPRVHFYKVKIESDAAR